MLSGPSLLSRPGRVARSPNSTASRYAEKAEYWALVWGIIVMAVTGIMLWAKMSVSHLLPRWWLDVATAIHFYEAVLASLAIVVWHFYQVFLDPDVYPMNWAWYDGKVSLHHYQEEHGLDGETLLTARAQTGSPGSSPGDDGKRPGPKGETLAGGGPRPIRLPGFLARRQRQSPRSRTAVPSARSRTPWNTILNPGHPWYKCDSYQGKS